TVTGVVLELHLYSPATFAVQLAERVAQAPRLFEGSPVVISMESLSAGEADIDLAGLLATCREAGLRPIAFRGLSPALAEAAATTALAVLPAGNGRERRTEPSAAKAPAETAPAAEVQVRQQGAAGERRPTRTVTRPVRSGQQIYAEGGDLIVLAPVSEGAEVLADGNIHVYGPLRGRALAGVLGDVSARIFCQHLDPELISVAGRFLLSDALGEAVLGKPAQVALEGDVLNVSVL
ncbi:MAG: septum site-determining protein MinC, partial [Parahaliea sp.]